MASIHFLACSPAAFEEKCIYLSAVAKPWRRYAALITDGMAATIT